MLYHANGMFKEAVESEKKAETLAPGKFKSALARYRQALETGKPGRGSRLIRFTPPLADRTRSRLMRQRLPITASKKDENPFARYNRERAEKDKKERPIAFPSRLSREERMKFTLRILLMVFVVIAAAQAWCGESENAPPPAPVRNPRAPSDAVRQMELPPPPDLPKLTGEPRATICWSRSSRDAIEQKDAAQQAELEYQLGRLIKEKYAGEDYERGISYLKSAAEKFEKLGKGERQAESLMQLGLLYRDYGEAGEAANCFEKALVEYEKGTSKTYAAWAAYYAGLTRESLAMYDKALEHYGRSLKISEELGDRRITADALVRIGDVNGSRGAYDPALEYYARSLKIHEELGNRAGEAAVLADIGCVYGMRGAYDPALDYLARSLKICEELGDRLGTAEKLGNIGNVYYFRGVYDQALQHFARSLKIGRNSATGAARRRRSTTSATCISAVARTTRRWSTIRAASRSSRISATAPARQRRSTTSAACIKAAARTTRRWTTTRALPQD